MMLPSESPPKLPDQYEILQRLGEGAVGIVFKARDRNANRQVAIKVLKQGASSQTFLRFRREFRAGSSFYHPHAAQVIELNVHEGTPYLIMEYVKGEALDSIIQRDGSLSPEDTLRIMKPVCAALDKAHGAGIVHRDLKPSNIMVQPDHTGKVLDFGIAKILDAGVTKLTQTGQVFGTPLYMSPEQIRAEKVDTRCDTYSLGAIMYQCLSGRPPHQADTPYAVMMKRLEEAPPFFSSLDKSVPPALELIVFKCLEIEPDKRYKNAGELLKDLDRVLGETNADDASSKTTSKTESSQIHKNPLNSLVAGLRAALTRVRGSSN